RVERDGPAGRFLLKRAVDAAKDQSYFLYRLGQAQLAAALFPLGELTKTKVRTIAREAGLPVHDRKESQDFYAGDLGELVGPGVGDGDIVDRDGRVLGRHRGVSHYTVGQRKGLGIASPVPLYVVAINGAGNRLIVGPESETIRRSAVVRDCVWGPFEALAAPTEVLAKVRSGGRLVPATISPLPDGCRVDFAEPVSAVAPGQSAVFYDGDTVVGGGIIESAA
ncbi:MAG: MnmA/TRMU family protein, partial [Candidatus Aminicenantales bacterium]